MKKRFKGIQVFLVIAISLFILAFPAYLRFNKLLQTKFVSSDLSFESPDQEEELSNKNTESKGFGPTAFFALILLAIAIKLLDRSSDSFPLSLSLREETPILRC